MSRDTSSYLPPPPPPPSPITVVGPQFTAAHPLDLLVTIKSSLRKHSSDVTDVNGNVLLKLNHKGTLWGTICLMDNAGNAMISLRPKTLSLSGIWRAYRGDSKELKDLLFTIKDSHFFGFKSKFGLNVFLAQNKDQKVPDFIIKPSQPGTSYTISFGASDSSTVIAHVHEKNSFKSQIKGKKIGAVTVNPNTDSAFMVTLVVALFEKLNASKIAVATAAGRSVIDHKFN